MPLQRGLPAQVSLSCPSRPLFFPLNSNCVSLQCVRANEGHGARVSQAVKDRQRERESCSARKNTSQMILSFAVRPKAQQVVEVCNRTLHMVTLTTNRTNSCEQRLSAAVLFFFLQNKLHYG